MSKLKACCWRRRGRAGGAQRGSGAICQLRRHPHLQIPIRRYHLIHSHHHFRCVDLRNHRLQSDYGQRTEASPGWERHRRGDSDQGYGCGLTGRSSRDCQGQPLRRRQDLKSLCRLLNLAAGDIVDRVGVAVALGGQDAGRRGQLGCRCQKLKGSLPLAPPPLYPPPPLSQEPPSDDPPLPSQLPRPPLWRVARGP